MSQGIDQARERLARVVWKSGGEMRSSSFFMHRWHMAFQMDTNTNGKVSG